MSGSHHDAIWYMVPRRESFWRWTKGAQSVEWKDGRTIAFRQEIAEILAYLAPGQLPRFDAVLLLLAACRDNWKAVDNPNQILAAYANAFEMDLAGVQKPAGLIISSIIPAAVRLDLSAVVEDLNRMAELPVELRQSLRAKCAIAETVFEGALRPIPTTTADAIVRALTEGLDPEPLFAASGPDDTYRQLNAELESLRQGLARVDAAQLRMRLATGLDQAVGPAPVKLPDSVRVRDLLSSLRDDPELAGVAQVALNLLAAIHMPRALAAPQDLPVGGVSDLSNRGPLDRLLVSELAHDDITLTTRIALNEALYLRREAPRSTPPRDRTILIDTGIRLWGVPRVFAVSVALALAASAEKGAHVFAFRPSGKSAEAADLMTRDGLLAQLQALDPSPHPGDAVRDMIQTLKNSDAIADIMLVTQEDVAADPDFIRVLHEIDSQREWHLAIVTREGEFKLQHLSRAGRRTLCSAQLSLDDLLEAPRKKRLVALLNTKIDPMWPVILSTEPFPLLLPAQTNAQRALVSRKFGLFSAIRDARLLRWTSDRKGATQLASQVPRGTFAGLAIDEDAAIVFYVSHQISNAQTHVLLADLEEPTSQTISVNAAVPLQAVAHHGGVLLLLYDCRAIALNAQGEIVADNLTPNDCHWHSSRFYRGPAGFSAAHFDGHAVQFTPLTERDSIAIFDREGHGPWQLLRGGHFSAVKGPPLPVRNPLGIRMPSQVAISMDGHRILGREGSYLDLNSTPLEWRKVNRNSHHLLVGSELSWSLGCGVNILNHWNRIYSNDAGELVLLRRTQGRAFQLNKSGSLILGYGAKVHDDRPRASFAHVQRPSNARFKLRIATWADGSRAYLDSRGMLHLKSSDKTLPEISIVLADGAIGTGGWTSDGHTFGSAFFHRQSATTPCDYIYDLLKQFSARLR